MGDHPPSRGRILCLAALVVLLASALHVTTSSAQLDDDDDGARTVETLENGQREAGLYSLRIEEADARPIVLHDESLLKWHNSVNQSVFGNIFVWTKAGRPEVVASIYQFYSPKVEFCAEFQSLSLDPLIVEKNGAEVWTPKEPGIVLQAFDDDDEPATSKPQRLIKMRQLAGQFSVQLTDWSGETYSLRLLPTPLFRYGATDSDSEILDGALFAFTYTTDPELLVIVEARPSDDGFRWVYGLARMNVGELTVSYGDREVWRAERLEHPYVYKDGIYTLFMNLPLPKPAEANTTDP
jgi:hypothetical protein